MDSSWGDISRRLQEGIGCFVDRAFEKGDPSCIVALHGQRIIGASLLDANTEATNHLLSGPMILHEYRNRGLGSGMLATSLAFLKDKGVSKALGVTRGNSISARFIYTKFSSTQSPFTLDPLQVSAR
jgi:GNAT superfamily N-acetyltransferase